MLSPISSASAIFWLSATANLVTGSPISARATVASNLLVGFPQTVPSGTLGSLYLKYQPHLQVVNGCVPFPAVDAAGDTK